MTTLTLWLAISGAITVYQEERMDSLNTCIETARKVTSEHAARGPGHTFAFSCVVSR